MEKKTYLPPHIVATSFLIETGFAGSGLSKSVLDFNFTASSQSDGYFRNQQFDYGYSDNGSFFGD
ncbi:MAG: hypothetical protein MJZ86_00740 [Bacteroidales bacterium]|nr:hypothetical protein [Bacteroidales bacterium]